MQGDFSRLTFDAKKQYVRVLLQQGRVLLDADWNEQAAILLHHLRLLTKYVIGPHGGPNDKNGSEPAGFLVTLAGGDLQLSEGPYFVGGMLCVAGEDLTYENQPDYPEPPEIQPGKYLVYLDVWERHVGYLEDGDVASGSIREVALGGPDTATRTRLVTQVKVFPVTSNAKADKWFDELHSKSTGRLRAHASERRASNDPCIVNPDARFRGSENQLYRVEVHEAGPAGIASFKWSRENGSVVFPIVGVITTGDGRIAVPVGHLGRDPRFGIDERSWAEIVDDDTVLWAPTVPGENPAHPPRPVFAVQGIDRDTLTITLDGASYVESVSAGPSKHPLLRRWEAKVTKIQEDRWMSLENGVEIQFTKPDDGTESFYRAGDYWLIPARTATGDVEWPRTPRNGQTEMDAVEPHGVEHAYALLAFVDPNATNPSHDKRRIYEVLAEEV